LTTVNFRGILTSSGLTESLIHGATPVPLSADIPRIGLFLGFLRPHLCEVMEKVRCAVGVIDMRDRPLGCAEAERTTEMSD
jgi:hypothetical protein